MARLMAAASGNLTSSGTWVVVDAATALVTEGGVSRTALTTTSQNSANITPTSNITIDALAIKVCDVAGSTGSVVVTLYNVTSTASVVSLTVPTADLSPGGTNGNGIRTGWVLLATGDQNLTSGSNYQVRLNITSGSSAVGCNTNGTAANWQHMFRTKTAAAPAATDDLFVLGLWTSSGTWTSYSVTQDQTTSGTVYGSNPGAGEERSGLWIGKNGTVAWANSASTNYVLALAGNVHVAPGGTFQMGTSGTPCSTSSTMTLQFNTTTNYGVLCCRGGTVTMYGTPRTAGINRNWTMLTAETSTGSATWAVADETGWKSGDTFYVSSSDANHGEYAAEYTLSGDATTASLSSTTTASATYRPEAVGAAAVGARCFLTKTNVTVQSDAAARYVRLEQYSTGDWDAQWLVVNYGGMQFNSPSADIAWRYVCINNKAQTHDKPFRITGASCGGTSSWQDIVWIGAVSGVAGRIDVTITNSDFSGWTIEDMFLVSDGTGGYWSITLASYAVFRRFYGLGGDGTLSLASIQTPWPSDVLAGSRVLGNGGLGAAIDLGVDMEDVTFSDIRWVVTGGGSASNVNNVWRNITFLNCWFLFAFTADFVLNNAVYHENIIFDGCKFGLPGAGAHSLIGDLSLANNVVDYTFYNCEFGDGATINGPTNLVNAQGMATSLSRVRMRLRLIDCLCSFTTLATAATPGYFTDDSIISINNYNRTADDHRICRLSQGISTSSSNVIQTDATTYKTAAPSEKMTPASASLKLQSSIKRVAVAQGATATVTVWVRKNAAYNGNAPRLMLLRNDTAGITAVTVCDTHTAAADNWEQLSYTTPAVDDNCVLEFYVDCDGTAGSIFVDDWAAS